MERFLNLFDDVKQFFVKEGELKLPQVNGWTVSRISKWMVMCTEEDSNERNQILFDFKQKNQKIEDAYIFTLRSGTGIADRKAANGLWDSFFQKVKEGQMETVSSLN